MKEKKESGLKTEKEWKVFAHWKMKSHSGRWKTMTGQGGKGRKGKGNFILFRKAPTGGKANMADDITTDQAYW